MENITTIDILLIKLWRYDPDILKLIFKFVYSCLQRQRKIHRYIEAIPKPRKDVLVKGIYKSPKSSICYYFEFGCHYWRSNIL